MINETKIAHHFWAEALNTTCYVQNNIYIRSILNKIPYELLKGRKSNIYIFFSLVIWMHMLHSKHQSSSKDI